MAKQGRLQQALLVIAVGVNVILLIFLVSDLRASGMLARPALTPQKDPAFGTNLPSSLNPFLDSQKPLLLVAFGQCSDCTLSNLNSWIFMLER